MADIASVKEAVYSEDLIIHRGLVLLGGILAGAAVCLALLSNLDWPLTNDQGIVGWITLGAVRPWAGLTAALVVVGAIAGALLSQWLWTWLGQGQRLLATLPASTALKRAAVPFSVFLPFLTFLYQGELPLVWPGIAFAGLGLGMLLLAFWERRDKRKIFFAHPTESEYHPASLFPHGAVITLGSGLGWFLQSLPGQSAGEGLWFALVIGIMVWIASLLLAGGFSLLFSKQTFDQSYLALALALLPLAFLPLQTIGWIHYLDHGKVVGSHQAGNLPMILVGLTVLASVGFLVFNLLRLRQLPTETSPAWEELFRALMLIVAVPCLVYAVGFWPAGAAYSPGGLAGPLDAFREGESLATAQAMLLGRLPFKEILLRHGFLTDAVSGLVAMQWFGVSLESLRFLQVLLAPLGLVAIYLLSIFCLPWLWAIILAFTLLTGVAGSVPLTRFFFPVIGFIFTLYYLQRVRWPILLLSGLLTALALIASFTAGIIALAGQFILLGAFGLFGSGALKNRLLHLAIYLGATLVALTPWWLYLAMSGSLGAYFNNFSWVLGNYHLVFSLPLPGWGNDPSLATILSFGLPPLVIVIGSLVVLNALRSVRETGGLPWNILLLLTITALLWLRYLGRGELAFLGDVLPFAVMLAFFFLYYLSRRQRRLRGLVFLALLPLLFIPQNGRHTLTALAGSFSAKNTIPVEGLTQARAERLSKAFLPPAQAKQFDELADYLEEQVGTAESFFDFSNQPILYFLVPRRPVTRELGTISQATFAQQLAVIRALAIADVKTVVFAGRRARAWDGLPVPIRQYAVSEFLLKKYFPTSVIGNSVIFSPSQGEGSAEPKAVAELLQPWPLAGLPYRWGSLSKYDPGQGGSVAQYQPRQGARAVEPAGVTITAKGDSLQAAEFVGPTTLRLVAETQIGEKGNVLVLKIRAPASLHQQTATLAWDKDAAGHTLSFTLQGDGRSHCYVFRVGALPGWVYAPSRRQLALQLPGGGWQWEGTTLLQVRDIPELTAVKKAGPSKAVAPAQP